jgi:hypothetical protein
MSCFYDDCFRRINSFTKEAMMLAFFKDYFRPLNWLITLSWYLIAVCHSTAHAQLSTDLRLFQFATAQQGAQILSTEDDYVRATAPLERQAKLRSAKPVSTTEFLAHMKASALEWSEADKALLLPHLLAVQTFAQKLAWQLPGPILIVRASAALEDNLPHTRASAIVLPDAVFQNFRTPLQHLLAHEVFHVLTRAHPELKSKAYALFGFEPCRALALDPAVSSLRITNPDAPISEHTIALEHRGKKVHALPYIMLPSNRIQPQEGFVRNLMVYWLFMEKDAQGQCSSSQGAWPPLGSSPMQLPDLFNKIGGNTRYLFHPEEIAAENFAILFMFEGKQLNAKDIASPEKIEQLRQLLMNR